MIKFGYLCAAAWLVAAAPAIASGPFDGTWKGDVAAAQPSAKPDAYLLTGAAYTCSTCVPAVSVPADGQFHAVTGHPYYDEISVAVVDPNTIKEATRKAGKPMAAWTTTVAADGKSATTTFNDMTAANGVAVTGTSVADRVAAGPAGAHAISGEWRDTNKGTVSDNGLTFTIATSGPTITYTSATGTTYTTRIGGPASPVTGDPGWTSVMVKSAGPGRLMETDLLDGKPISKMEMAISADGKRMTVKVDDLVHAKQGTYFATRQ
jgi:hypothetical protein